MTNDKNCKYCKKIIYDPINSMMHLYFCNDKYCTLVSDDINHFVNCFKLLQDNLNNIKNTNSIYQSELLKEIVDIKKYLAVCLENIDVTDIVTKSIAQTMYGIIKSTDENQCVELLVLLSHFKEIQSKSNHHSNINTINKIFIKLTNKNISDLHVFMKLYYFSKFIHKIDTVIYQIPNNKFKKIIKSCYNFITDHKMEPETVNDMFVDKAKEIIQISKTINDKQQELYE